MECKLNKELLIAYREECIDELEKIFVEEHLRYCQTCQEDISAFDQLDQALKSHFFAISTPNVLDQLAQSVAQNAIKIESVFQPFDLIRQTLSVSKALTKNLYYASKLQKNDPYHRYLDRQADQVVQATFQVVSQPLKNMIKKRILRMIPLRN